MTERNSVDALEMELPKWLDLISTSGWRTSRNEVITEFSLSKKILRILKNRILMCKEVSFFTNIHNKCDFNLYITYLNYFNVYIIYLNYFNLYIKYLNYFNLYIAYLNC